MTMQDFWSYPISQGFGPTTERLDGPYAGHAHFNKGLDFAAPSGTSVRSPVGGEVISVGDVGDGWGTRVWVRDAQGNVHNFGHLSGTSVRLGDLVSAGDLVGISGNTGRSTGPHVSYDVWNAEGEYFDPAGFVSGGVPAASGPAAGPVGPDGRTYAQVMGKPYLSQAEREWYHAQQGSTPPSLITSPTAGSGGLGQTPPPGGATMSEFDPAEEARRILEEQRKRSELQNRSTELSNQSTELTIQQKLLDIEKAQQAPAAPQPTGTSVLNEDDLRGAGFKFDGLIWRKTLDDGTVVTAKPGDRVNGQLFYQLFYEDPRPPGTEKVSPGRQRVNEFVAIQRQLQGLGDPVGGAMGEEAAPTPMDAPPAAAPGGEFRGRDAAMAQFNRGVDAQGVPGPLSSVDVPTGPGGSRNLGPGWAAATLATFNMKPSGNFEEDLATALAIENRRNEAVRGGLSPLEAQTSFDALQFGATMHDRVGALEAQERARVSGLTGGPTRTRPAYTAAQLRGDLSPAENPEFFDADFSAAAGKRVSEGPSVFRNWRRRLFGAQDGLATPMDGLGMEMMPEVAAVAETVETVEPMVGADPVGMAYPTGGVRFAGTWRGRDGQQYSRFDGGEGGHWIHAGTGQRMARGFSPNRMQLNSRANLPLGTPMQNIPESLWSPYPAAYYEALAANWASGGGGGGSSSSGGRSSGQRSSGRQSGGRGDVGGRAMGSKVADTVAGPAVLRVGERARGDKKFATDEYLLAPPGTVVAPRKRGEKPTMANAIKALMNQAERGPPPGAAEGTAITERFGVPRSAYGSIGGLGSANVHPGDADLDWTTIMADMPSPMAEYSQVSRPGLAARSLFRGR